MSAIKTTDLSVLTTRYVHALFSDVAAAAVVGVVAVVVVVAVAAAVAVVAASHCAELQVGKGTHMAG